MGLQTDQKFKLVAPGWYTYDIRSTSDINVKRVLVTKFHLSHPSSFFEKYPFQAMKQVRKEHIFFTCAADPNCLIELRTILASTVLTESVFGLR